MGSKRMKRIEINVKKLQAGGGPNILNDFTKYKKKVDALAANVTNVWTRTMNSTEQQKETRDEVKGLDNAVKALEVKLKQVDALYANVSHTFNASLTNLSEDALNLAVQST